VAGAFLVGQARRDSATACRTGWMTTVSALLLRPHLCQHVICLAASVLLAGCAEENVVLGTATGGSGGSSLGSCAANINFRAVTHRGMQHASRSAFVRHRSIANHRSNRRSRSPRIDIVIIFVSQKQG
jgi:hypothetical protein